MAKMVQKKCNFCKQEMEVRAADVARGWGKFCSKSCKAKRQEKRTGQYKAYLNGFGVSNLHPERLSDYGDHPYSPDGHGQWL